jgi:hypothetical protein
MRGRRGVVREPGGAFYTAEILAAGLALLLSSPAMAQTTFQSNTDRRTQFDYEEFTMGRPNPQL